MYAMDILNAITDLMKATVRLVRTSFMAIHCMILSNVIPIECDYNSETYVEGETFPAGDGCNNW